MFELMRRHSDIARTAQEAEKARSAVLDVVMLVLGTLASLNVVLTGIFRGTMLPNTSQTRGFEYLAGDRIVNELSLSAHCDQRSNAIGFENIETSNLDVVVGGCAVAGYCILHLSQANIHHRKQKWFLITGMTVGLLTCTSGRYLADLASYQQVGYVPLCTLVAQVMSMIYHILVHHRTGTRRLLDNDAKVPMVQI